MKTKPFSILLAFLTTALILFACSSAKAQDICNPDPGWTNFANPPQVNQTHIFCGEFKNNQPKGFHSRPNGINPSTVKAVKVTQSPNSQGLYGIEWTYSGTSVSKFSTIYPDRCSQSQVLNSVRYAEANRVQCPASAPNWAWCGKNQPNSVPSADKNLYCQSNDGTRFTIAGATLNNGNINTAFPLR